MKHTADCHATPVNEERLRTPIMKTHLKSYRALICAALTTFGLATTHAQTTANWIGPAAGGEWTAGANWDTGFPPLDATTNAFIGSGTNVNYNLPMPTSGFGLLTLNGGLIVNTNGFNNTGILMNFPTGTKSLWITNSGAAVNITGDLTMGSNTVANLGPGASLNISGRLIVAASESSSANNTSAFTNSGGNLSASSTAVNNNTGTGTGILRITGGTNNLGNTSVGRYHGSSVSTLGAEGLAITGGSVTISNLTLSGPSFLTGFISGGTVTNYGSVFINGVTAGRYSRLFQTGGYFVVPEPGIINLNSTTAGALTAIYSVTGGTNIVGGFYFGNSNTLTAATQSLTNSAVIYVGSLGITVDGVSINTLALNNGGMFGANADWSGNADMLLNAGAFTFQAAAQDGTAHNITLSGALRGTGALDKTGPGTLTLAGNNIYSGVTYIKNGTLALGINQVTTLPGSLASGNITVGSGAIFDVSQEPGYAVNPLQTLGGFGSVNGSVTVAPTGIINAGSNTVTGALTFNSDLIETNGAVNHFDVPGDVINVAGSLNVTGSNVVEIAGSVAPGTPYALFHYGTFSGDVSAFGISGATGILSNSVADQAIYLVVSSSLRANTNVTWVGNSTANDWDTHNLTNWINAGTSALDSFLSGDTALFTDLGGNNTNVNIPGTVSPAAVIVNSTSNYVFSGLGGIAGPNASLTKTNSGNLTILTTNTYAGPTTFAGGVVDVLDLENGGTPSALGSSPADSSSLVFNGGTLEYLGGNKTIDHGATFQTNGGTLSITNGSTLTMSGTLTGPGALTKIGNGQLTLNNPNSYLGGTTISAGTIRAAQGSGATISALGTNTITLNGTTSAATFNFGGDAEVLNNPLNIVNTNNFILNGGNDQVLDVTGSGLVNLEGTGANVLTFAGDMSTFNGTFYLDTLPNARFLPNSGTVVGGSNVIFNLGTGSSFLNNRNGNLSVLLGSLYGGPSTTAQGASSTDNRPTTYIIGLNNASSQFDGRFTEVSAARKVNLVKSGTGTFTLTGDNIYTGFTTVSNGVLALAQNTNTFADGSLDNTTNIEITSTGILDVSSRSDGTLQLGGNQTLAGSGVLRGTLNNSGTLAPDGGTPNTTGTLTVTNIANLFNLTWMKLNRGSTPVSDRLIAPTINLGGNLVITNSGAPLHAGDTFSLFSGTLAGGFGSITLPNYYTFDTTQLTAGGNGTITVTSYTPPVMKADYSAFSTGTITFNITGGIIGNGVSILSSTNLALPLTNWTTAATGNFDGSGDFSAPVTVDPAVPQQYYIMLTQ